MASKKASAVATATPQKSGGFSFGGVSETQAWENTKEVVGGIKDKYCPIVEWK